MLTQSDIHRIEQFDTYLEIVISDIHIAPVCHCLTMPLLILLYAPFGAFITKRGNRPKLDRLFRAKHIDYEFPRHLESGFVKRP